MPWLARSSVEQVDVFEDASNPNKGHPPAAIAGFSGWLLDAFDFFLRSEDVTTPVARDNSVVDLLPLDTRHKRLVGFMPITGLKIPLKQMWSSEPVRLSSGKVQLSCSSAQNCEPDSANAMKRRDLGRLL